MRQPLFTDNSSKFTFSCYSSESGELDEKGWEHEKESEDDESEDEFPGPFASGEVYQVEVDVRGFGDMRCYLNFCIHRNKKIQQYGCTTGSFLFNKK